MLFYPTNPTEESTGLCMTEFIVSGVLLYISIFSPLNPYKIPN